MNFVGDQTSIPQLAHTLTPAFEQAAKDGPELLEGLLATVLARYTIHLVIEVTQRTLWELDQVTTLDEAKEKMRGYQGEYSTVAMTYPLVEPESAPLTGAPTPSVDNLAQAAASSLFPVANASLSYSARAINPGGYL